MVIHRDYLQRNLCVGLFALARAVLHAPLKWGDLGCVSIHGQHVIDKVLLFIHHVHEEGQIYETLSASMSTTQIECGTSTNFFLLNAQQWYGFVTNTRTIVKVGMNVNHKA